MLSPLVQLAGDWAAPLALLGAGVIALLTLLLAHASWLAIKRQCGLGALDQDIAAPAYNLPPPPHCYTRAELRDYDGENRKAILIALDGDVYDITSHPSGRSFYGKDGAYHVFAGRDATIALATMDFDRIASDDDTDSGGGRGSGDGQKLSDEETKTLEEWKVKFRQKYVVVGTLGDN